jgi:hypothetical protein
MHRSLREGAAAVKLREHCDAGLITNNSISALIYTANTSVASQMRHRAERAPDAIQQFVCFIVP